MPTHDEVRTEPYSTVSAASGREPVRVLFVYDHLGYAAGATHGLTRYCLDVLPRLDPEVVRVRACFLREEHPAKERLLAAGVPVTFLRRSRWAPRALPDVVREIRKDGTEVVHASGQKGTLVGRAAARITGARVLIHLHDMTPPSPLVAFLLRATSGWTDHAIGVSRAVAEFASGPDGVHRGPVEVLYNGFDARKFTPPAEAVGSSWRAFHGIDPTDPTVGVIGRLSPEKGHARLLRQMPSMMRDLPSLRLAFVGDGPLRANLVRRVREMNLEDHVLFTGHQEDVLPALSALDVVAIPSPHEGFSFVALEAMSAGTLVVSASKGGIREVLGDGAYGILVDPEDEGALGRAIIDVLRNPSGADATRARARDRASSFSLDRHVAALQALYLRLGRGISGAEVSPHWSSS